MQCQTSVQTNEKEEEKSTSILYDLHDSLQSELFIHHALCSEPDLEYHRHHIHWISHGLLLIILVIESRLCE